MPQNRITRLDLLTLFNLRVLLRHDAKFAVHVAHCIETGNVVTADSADEAKEMMKELLEDEISFAIRNRNLKNLFSSPAPLDVLTQWIRAAQENDPQTEFLDLNLNEMEILKIEPKNAGLQNQLRFATAA